MQVFICARLAIVFAFGTGALAGSIKDIKHVVLFMQENRAFDHVS
jgi:phospholipase C